MDLSTLSLTQLQELQQRIPAEIKRREESEKQAFLEEVRALAKSRGLSFDEVLSKARKASPRAGGTVKAKYQHPTNPSLQWTGRGRKPLWVQELLNQGRTLESITI